MPSRAWASEEKAEFAGLQENTTDWITPSMVVQGIDAMAESLNQVNSAAYESGLEQAYLYSWGSWEIQSSFQELSQSMAQG